VALEKLDDITAAYVNDGIILHLAGQDAYDEAAVAEALKPFKLKVTEATLVEGSPFAD